MQVFDFNGHLYDIGYGPQHRDLGKRARSAILASMIGIGISVDWNPRLTTAKRVVALCNRSAVEPA